MCSSQLVSSFVKAAGAAVCVAAGFLLGRFREYGALVGGGVFTLPLCLLLAGVGLLLLALLAWVGVLQASSCLLYTVRFLQARDHSPVCTQRSISTYIRKKKKYGRQLS